MRQMRRTTDGEKMARSMTAVLGLMICAGGFMSNSVWWFLPLFFGGVGLFIFALNYGIYGDDAND